MDYRAPMHRQLYDILRDKIESGELTVGRQIPSERELAAAYGLARMTVRHAITILVKEGLLQRIHGKGTYVIRRKLQRDLDSLSGFSKTMLQKGVTPGSRLITSGKLPAEHKLQTILAVQPDTPLFRLYRLRLADNEPVALEDTYIPFDLIPNIENIDFQVVSLYDVLEHNGIDLDYSLQTLTLAKVSGNQARLLKVPPGTAVFLFEYTSVDQGGRIIEYTKSFTRSDKSTFHTVLR